MALLLDTNVILFGLLRPSAIPKAVRARVANPSERVVVSVASIYEIGFKVKLGKLALPDGFDLQDHIIASDMELLSITASHAARASDLPLINRDPWDRLIVAQCLVDGHQLVSSDDQITGLGIGRIW